MARKIDVIDLFNADDRARLAKLHDEGVVMKEKDFFGIGAGEDGGTMPILQRVVDIRSKDPQQEADQSVYTPPIC